MPINLGFKRDIYYDLKWLGIDCSKEIGYYPTTDCDCDPDDDCSEREKTEKNLLLKDDMPM